MNIEIMRMKQTKTIKIATPKTVMTMRIRTAKMKATRTTDLEMETVEMKMGMTSGIKTRRTTRASRFSLTKRRRRF